MWRQRSLIPLAVAALCVGALLNSASVRALTLTVGPQPGCSHATLQQAFDAIRSVSGSHELRVMKGNYAVPGGMIYDPATGVSQSAVFVVGGFTHCADAAPSGDPTIDADRAVFDGAGGLARSVLDLDLNGRVGTFQMRRVVLRGGDAGNGANEFFNIGGGLVVRGQASVLLGLGTSIRNNSAGRGGGVALVGSPVGSGSVATAFKADLYITEGADITQNSAAAEGGGIYCGGTNVSTGANVQRHGTIILVDGFINGNSANSGGAFNCFGSAEVGGGFQPNPDPNRAGWILLNSTTSPLSGCAAGRGTLDASIPADPDGRKSIGAGIGENGMLAITNHSGVTPALCLSGSVNLGTTTVNPSANRFRLRNFYQANHTGTGMLALYLINGVDLQITPSALATQCSFLAPTPCVRFSDNTQTGTPTNSAVGDPLLLVLDGALDVQRASIRDNATHNNLLVSAQNLRISASVMVGNSVDNDGSLFMAYAGGDIKMLHNTVYQNTSARFFRLDNGTATAQASIFGSTAMPPPATVGGTSPPSNFTRRWCGFYQSLDGFGGHSEIADPTVGAFIALGPTALVLDGSFTPLSASLTDACTLDADVTRDFYGSAYGMQIEPFAVAFADIGAVEAPLPPSAIFNNGFE